MMLASKWKIALLLAGVVLLGWQFRRHLSQRREWIDIQTQLGNRRQEIEARQSDLAALEKKNQELVEVERRAGNQTLITLMRERSAITMTNAQALAAHTVGGALANMLLSPEQQAIDREATRNQMRASMGVFFKLTNLSPEQIDQYIDVQIEMQRRDAVRKSALLRGTMTVAEALQQRDNDLREQESRGSAILGTEGTAFLQSIADGMRNDEATRLINAVQENMNGNTLNLDQSNRLQGLIKTELTALKLDDTDLFRSPDDFVQFVGGHQQNILNQAAAFLTPPQLDALKNLAALDLAQQKEQMLLKRKSLGIK